MPITRLDGKPVGEGKPGAMFSRLYRLYQSYKQTTHARRRYQYLMNSSDQASLIEYPWTSPSRSWDGSVAHRIRS